MRRALLAICLVAATAAPAAARTEKTLAYPRPEAWAAAVRFIRVDAHLKVTEKDAEAGYVLFELHEENKTFRGSLELVDVVEDGRHAIRFVIQLEDRPSYEEIELMMKLESKLRAEIGAPSPPADKPAPPTKPEPAKPEPPKDDRDKPVPPPGDAPPISATP